MSKDLIYPSPDSTPHNNIKSTISEWENTPSPLQYNEATDAKCTNLNTREYEKDDSPLLESTFCNPEPPVELIEHHLVNADNIGDSVFSKHWLLTTLIKLIKYVDENSVKDFGEKIDIDDEFQDELCKLWDISMDREVVLYLMECKSIDLLKGVLTKSNAPRITEICIGILANMVCLPIVCEQICNDPEFLIILIELFDDHDTPTLIELFRLLNVCLEGNNSKPLIAIIMQKSYVYMKVVFILQSSTNDSLLECCSEFVWKLLENNEDICEKWGKDELVLAIMEAIKQTGAHKGEYFEPFLHALQIFTTFESGLQSLETYCGEIMLLCMSSLSHLSHNDEVIIDSKEKVLCYVLSIVKALFVNWDGCVSSLVDDYHLIKSLLKILASVSIIYSKTESENNTEVKSLNNECVHNDHQVKDNCDTKCDATNDDEVTQFKNQIISLIYELLKNIFCDIFRKLHKVKDTNCANVNKIVNVSCPVSLQFLDSCHQHQLKQLFSILSTTKYNFPLQNNSIKHSKLEKKYNLVDCNIKNLIDGHSLELTSNIETKTPNLSSNTIEVNSNSDHGSYMKENLDDETTIINNPDLKAEVRINKCNPNLLIVSNENHTNNKGLDNNNFKSDNGECNDYGDDINCSLNIAGVNKYKDTYLNLLFKDAMHYKLEKLSRFIQKFIF